MSNLKSFSLDIKDPLEFSLYMDIFYENIHKIPKTT
jgi:hypothetical protein